MSGLIINQFNAGYPKRPVIENLSTDILPRGKITYCYPNGSGKSTLLRSLAGLNTSNRAAYYWMART